MDKRKTVIGVTGTYASGKSTVADMLVEKGALKIDADAIGHEVLMREEVKDRIVAIWGEGVLRDGLVDRKALAEKVFSSRNDLKKLCEITHPRIIEEIEQRINDAESGVIVLDAPLLLEAGLRHLVDRVVVVRTSAAKCAERAVCRGADMQRIRNIIDSQMPAEKKEELADHIIDNNGDMEKTKEGVDKLWQGI